MSLDIMIDLETLSTSTDCVVLSIGAVKFDIEKGELGETFYTTLHIQDQINQGRKISESTLRFWLDQDREVFKQALQIPMGDAYGASNKEILSVFSNFIGSDSKVWGNSSGFDINIMESLFATYGLKEPWKYSAAMDLRTFKRFLGDNDKIARPVGQHHNALSDAVNQAQFVLDHTIHLRIK